MKRMMWILPVLAMVAVGCTGWELRDASTGRAVNAKGKYIIDNKLVAPPYDGPIWRTFGIPASQPGDGIIRVNGLAMSTPIKDKATADRFIATFNKEMDKGLLLVISSEDNGMMTHPGDYFDKAKAILVSGKSEDDMIGELNALFQNNPNSRKFLAANK